MNNDEKTKNATRMEARELPVSGSYLKQFRERLLDSSSEKDAKALHCDEYWRKIERASTFGTHISELLLVPVVKRLQ